MKACLVLSEEIGDDIILCQITSQNIPKDTFSVSISPSDTLKGSLKISSYARCNMLFTADKIDCKKVLCSISPNKYDK
ncbi:MAG: type II toxin-antitoxin system PemK/MazF family toxin [Candidatus Woesearchaeota archaeon]